ncbi:MAG: hypothetical protein WCP40_05635, partial [Opitutae bacterium]
MAGTIIATIAASDLLDKKFSYSAGTSNQIAVSDFETRLRILKVLRTCLLSRLNWGAPTEIIPLWFTNLYSDFGRTLSSNEPFSKDEIGNPAGPAEHPVEVF